MMKLIPSPPLKSVAALAAVAVFTCMLAASPVRAGAFEEYRAVDMKLQSVREGDAEGLRAAGVLVESFSKRWSKGTVVSRSFAGASRRVAIRRPTVRRSCFSSSSLRPSRGRDF